MTDIVERLRERAVIARDEGNATATSDAYHFEEAAKELDRLRAQIKFGSCTTRITNNGIDVGHCTLKPEVERLRADNARLRAALREIADGMVDIGGNRRVRFDSCDIARAALEGKDE